MCPSRLLQAALPALLLSAIPPACSTQEWSPYAQRGQFAVGTREMIVAGSGRLPAVPVTLWYPALNPGDALEQTIYLGSTEGVGPAGQAGACPLVVFSPDSSKGRMLYAPLLEHLASYGFIVIAFSTLSPEPDPSIRLRDAHRVIGFAASLGPLTGSIDTDRIALAGHGEGAVMALCAVGQARKVEASASLEDPGPCVRAVVALAPGHAPKADAELSLVHVPVLLMGGSVDRSRSPWRLAEVYGDLASNRKAGVLFIGGGHDLFGIARDDVAVSMDLAPLDAGSWDIHRTGIVVRHITTAFPLEVLTGDADARRAILAGPAGVQNVQYTITWAQASGRPRKEHP